EKSAVVRPATGDRRYLTIRNSQASSGGRERHSALHQCRLAKLIVAHARHIGEPALREIVGIHSRDAVANARIPVHVPDIHVVHDVYVVNQHISIAISAVVTPPPPTVKGLVRGQRYPTKIGRPESESGAKSTKAEERHQRRAPVMPLVEPARGPAPAIGRSIEPTSVVIRRP